MIRSILLAALALAASLAWGQERQVGAIKTNTKLHEEQPKVLYIVPWQPPQSPKLQVQEPAPDLEEGFKPLERDFYRQSLYFRQNLKVGVLSDQP